MELIFILASKLLYVNNREMIGQMVSNILALVKPIVIESKGTRIEVIKE